MPRSRGCRADGHGGGWSRRGRSCGTSDESTDGLASHGHEADDHQIDDGERGQDLDPVDVCPNGARTGEGIAAGDHQQEPERTGDDAEAGNGDRKALSPFGADEEAAGGNDIGNSESDDERQHGDDVLEGREVGRVDRHPRTHQQPRQQDGKCRYADDETRGRQGQARNGTCRMDGHESSTPSVEGMRHPASGAMTRSAVCPVWRATEAKNAARLNETIRASLHAQPATRQAPTRPDSMVTIGSVRNWFGWNMAPDSFLPVPR